MVTMANLFEPFSESEFDSDVDAGSWVEGEGKVDVGSEGNIVPVQPPKPSNSPVKISDIISVIFDIEFEKTKVKLRTGPEEL
jgi:hypothetical protein